MKLSDYTTFDGLGLADLVRKREVTPAELLECASMALSQVNPDLNAVIRSLRDDAEQALRAGLPEGPFTGVPFLVKDLSLLTAGAPTGMGARLFQRFVAPVDSEQMARFRRAGLVTFGKTSTSELGLNVVTEPRAHGPTRNPWRTDLSPGGSSGGSGAAVAARIVPLAHGTDAAGSIRIPASCCGLFGLKPTRGRNPAGPLEGEQLAGLAAEHVLTRSVRDSAAMLDVTAGADPGAPYTVPPPARSFLEETRTPPGKLRIAFMEEPLNGVPVSDACQQALRRTLTLCEELGHELVPARPQVDAAQLRAVFNLIPAFTAYTLDMVAPMYGLEAGPETVEATTLALLAAGRRMSAAEVFAAFALRDQISRTVGHFFTRFDVLLSPTLAAPPLPLGTLDANDPTYDGFGWMDRLFTAVPFTPLANVTGDPAMSVPLHVSEDGLPIGVHFEARQGDEATLFRLAAQLEEAAPWASRRPGICAG
ncbi:amidase [Chondromyces apiculatus]|uniref:Aspartyl-tRNA(Asn) amidotransferase subunit A n=1 Tax=Chondromyces apiculatus DSM 436 TaxID=1192034 RepID=A0A017T6Q0_9BACT|nr:amidase family protein [Chondromyces apiculatus]EYF04682.1 Aspartyl-tRNA(Asn) amidotransferase subunit A [Chondromyces apiculatus DSM 436]